MDLSRLTAMVLVLLPVAPVMAAEYIAETGFHTGGDTIGSGYSVSAGTETLGGGDGYSLAVGFGFGMGDSSSLIFTVGMKKEALYPDDGTISFDRYPVNLLLMKNTGKLQYGLGITYHLNPLYREETSTVNQTIGFEDAMGYLLELRYTVFDKVYISSRYTRVDYEIEEDPANTSYDGSSIGLLVGIVF